MILLRLSNEEMLEVQHCRVTSNRDALVVLDPNGNKLAMLTWNVDTGEIGTVKIINSDYLRRGIATALFNLANTYMHVKHSEYRTKSGDAWAHSVGGEIPPLKTKLRMRNNEGSVR